MTRLRRLVAGYGDAALALALALVAALAAAPAGRPAGTAVVVLTALPIALRRRLPVVVVALVIGGLLLTDRLLPRSVGGSPALFLAFVLALYSVGRHARGGESWFGPPAVVAAVVVLDIGDGDSSPAGVFFYLVVAGAPWAAGLAIRLWVDRVAEQRQRNAVAAELAAQAVAQERARIARELHDVVARAIAATIEQTRAARRLVGADDAAVRRALGAIEATNTAALADMRRLLALLRQAERTPSTLEPAPTLDGLAELATSGTRVVVSGDRMPLSPGVEASAFRVVQELAAADRATRVRVEYGADELLLHIETSESAAAAVLAGVRERVAVAGGSLATHPAGDGTVTVATFPYAPVPVP